MRYAGTIIFWLCKKCIWIFLTLAALSNARCSTTTQGALGAHATNAWITEHESQDARVALRDRSEALPIAGTLLRESPAGQLSLLSPERMRLVSGANERAIPLESVREVKVVKRARGALEGALIGLGVGVLSGIALGLSQGDSPHPDDCGYPCTSGEKMRFWGVLSGGLGAGLGAIVGAAIGHRDLLTF